MIKEVTRYSLYCGYCGSKYDHFNITEFKTKEDCYKFAVEDGWCFTIDGKFICDECAERKVVKSLE